jgi:pyrimidine operon attenuation protein / uracil phosphoribosyltransferase
MVGPSGDAPAQPPAGAAAPPATNADNCEGIHTATSAMAGGGHGREVSRLALLTAAELQRTLDRLASQVLERVADSDALLLLGIPTRGVALARVLAERLEGRCGHPVACGSLDPTFHRDDLGRIGTRMVEPTQLPVGLEGREVVLVDDVIFTGRTVRAALEALQAWGRPRRVHLVAMVDRGHRELPIQPDFCGRVVPTTRQESIQVCLQVIDGEEGVFLLRPTGPAT